MTDSPLVNLGELTKPATVLIERASDAVGGLFKPFQIVRVARAEAEAERIRAESGIQITDLHRRAVQRFLEEEATRQSNMENILREAVPLLEEDSSPQDLERDWITNFFDKCRIVSDEDMQRLWSRVLATEANAPGAFSRKTVNLMNDLDKSDAELFTRLCGFAWDIDAVVVLVFGIRDEMYNRNNIGFSTLSHLESLGLIQVSHLSGFENTGLPKTVAASYHGKSVNLTLPKDIENSLNLGNVILTRAGRELVPVCESRPVDGYFDFVYDRWAAQSLVPKRETKKGAPRDG